MIRLCAQDSYRWGSIPDKEVECLAKNIKGGKALDIGAGDGRNSIFLSKERFSVCSIDASATEIERLKKHAIRENVAVSAKTSDVRNFSFPKKSYHLVVAANVLGFLSFSDFKKTIRKIEGSLVLGGIFYLSVFSTDDPSYINLTKQAEKEDVRKGRRVERVEETTFLVEEIATKKSRFVHFFTEKELESVFSQMKIINIKKEWFEDVFHGKLHYHDTIKLIARKEN